MFDDGDIPNKRKNDWFEQGQEADENSEYEKDVRRFTKKLQKNPHDKLALENRSLAYAELRMYNEAGDDADLLI